MLLKEKQEVESFVVLQGNEGEVEIVREGINVVVNEVTDIIFLFFESINQVATPLSPPPPPPSSYLFVVHLREPL